MGISKQQKTREARICACGCEQTFYPFPIYRPKRDGGGLRWPLFMRGHNPAAKKTTFGNVPAWNVGLKKGDHPSLERMGFRPGHEPFNDWTKVNQRLREDKEFHERWRAAKKGQKAWQEGMNGLTHPDKIKSGANHPLWKGNPGGIRETLAYRALRKSTFERDNYTCQECGARTCKGRGATVHLHMHHVVAVCHDRSRALDPTNVTTLCKPCHEKTETFGPKALKVLRCNPRGN